MFFEPFVPLHSHLEKRCSLHCAQKIQRDPLSLNGNSTDSWPWRVFFEKRDTSITMSDDLTSIITQSRDFVNQMPDGSFCEVVARDRLEGVDFTPWIYGLALKVKRRLVLLFDTTTESWNIDGIDYYHLVKILAVSENASALINDALRVLETIQPTIRPALKKDRTLVIVAHGFSPDTGPDYPLMHILSHALRSDGYSVTLPDFRYRKRLQLLDLILLISRNRYFYCYYDIYLFKLIE